MYFQRRFLMVKYEELFVLIKSLSRSEKRYFKLMAGQQKEANYLLLFDAIDSQTVYDEAAIKQKFSGAAFIKQLHVTKHYLREQILASLRSFHNSMSKDAELKQLLRNIEILFHKELYEHCRTEIEKASRLAEKYELLSGQIEVLNWKRKLEQAKQPHNFSLFLSYADQQRVLINKMLDTNAYWQHMVLDTRNMFAGNAPKEDFTVSKVPEKPVSLETQVMAYNLQYIELVSKREQSKAQEKLYELIDLLEQYPHRLKEDPSSYVSTINNLAGYLMFQKRDKDVYNLLAKAKKVYDTLSLKTENKSLLKQIMRTYSLELELYRSSKKKANALPGFVVVTEGFLEKNKNKLPKDYLLSLWFQLAHVRFTANDLDAAQKWLNNILNTRFGDIRRDLQVQARMLNLMVHFEQKNFFVLRYFVGSTKRFLKKMKEVELFEDILFRFFAKLSTAPEYEYKSLFRDVYGQLFPLNEESVIPENVLDYINYKDWLDSKRHKKSHK